MKGEQNISRQKKQNRNLAYFKANYKVPQPFLVMDSNKYERII